MTLQRGSPACNSTYKKLAVQWLNDALCFVSNSVVVVSFRLRNRQLLVAANRYGLYKTDTMTDFQTYQERLDFIKYLAEQKRTGTAKSLAQKLGVSVRTAKRMIKHIRNNGVNIKFDKSRQTYYLEK